MSKPESDIGSSASVWDKQAADYDLQRQEDAVYLSCVDLVTRPIPKETPIVSMLAVALALPQRC